MWNKPILRLAHTHERRWLRFGWALLAALTLSGCLLPRDSAPPQQSYLLEVTDFKSLPTQRPGDKILLVTVSKEAPGFDTNRIAYTREPLKLDYYQDSHWSDTPAKMLLPILVRAFETTGAFKAVVSPPSPSLADYRVDVDIIRLQQELMTQPSQVRFIARIKVLDMRNRHVLATRVFQAAESAPSENAYGAAQAANTAVRKVLEEMIPFALQYTR